MTEKREYHRMKIQVPMTYRLPPRMEEISTATLDIGGTGMSFIAPEELRLRHELLIYLSPSNERIEIHGKVVRVDEIKDQPGYYRVGVRIVDRIKFDERKFIKFYAGQLSDVFRSDRA